MQIGDLVKMGKLSKEMVPYRNYYYPRKGTIGRVTYVNSTSIWVQWPVGKTKEPGIWSVCQGCVEIVLPKVGDGVKLRDIPYNKYIVPPIDTIGTIIRVDIDNKDGELLIQWPKGTTIYDDLWWYPLNAVEIQRKNL